MMMMKKETIHDPDRASSNKRRRRNARTKNGTPCNVLHLAFFVAILLSTTVLTTLVHAAADSSPNSSSITRIGFGSCHKSIKAASPPIWDVIDDTRQNTLDAWLWLGDIMYPPKPQAFFHGVDSVETIQQSLQELHTNQTIGYQRFLERNAPKIKVAGVWDDHDYGGNDMGVDMPDKNERRRAFWDFLGYSERWDHDGMYHRVDLAQGKVRVLILDTRWFREEHCIPSVAHRFKLGNAIACATRWLTSGLLLHRVAWLWGRGGCENNAMLGEEQWHWLEKELMVENDDDNGPELFLVLSSVQIWSTNPAMEGWGQFPGEQKRLWNLLKRHYYDNRPTAQKEDDGKGPAPVIFLSGDVHHGEIIGQQGYLEVTSSGMTHHCGQPKLYGRLCQPILETFHAHRREKSDYYVGLNYGTVDIDWEERVVQLAVRNSSGEAVLQVNHALDGIPRSLPDYDDLPHTMDGHFLAYAIRFLWAVVVAVLIASRWLF